jgi:hypothetical protein
MAHGDARLRKWRGNCRMEWVASTLHTVSEHGVSSITTADAHTSAASSRLNWRFRRFKWTHPFRRKMKAGFCACAITFQLAYTIPSLWYRLLFVFPWLSHIQISLIFHFLSSAFLHLVSAQMKFRFKTIQPACCFPLLLGFIYFTFVMYKQNRMETQEFLLFFYSCTSLFYMDQKTCCVREFRINVFICFVTNLSLIKLCPQFSTL